VFVNVANYAYGDGQGDVKLNLSFEQKTRLVTFQLIDSGVAFNPLDKPDPDITLSAEQRKIGGLGILITKKTMDLVTYDYQNGQNILTMQKKI
jgi:anti-sigma regulatory factor (Ser/Thr protein kinase)